ncbi:BMP family ABC transporter substrate-binding protein [Spirochaetia bacterium]|nr:BMP family ABC transporter substrate-binding protein [Spirochaetia bacterium]
MKKILLVVCTLVMILGCTKKNDENNVDRKKVAIAVFIPGLRAGSPVYDMLATGVQRAGADFSGTHPVDVTVTVIEAGVNQAEWEPKLESLAAKNTYDLIVSSNPSIPAIVASVSDLFPTQKFLLLDGELADYPTIYTLRYNQHEQSYLAGYAAALAAAERRSNRIGLIAAQEYPVMNNIILPGFIEGARAVSPDFSVDFRILGNWFDAGKAADLAAGMIRDGAAVILPIAGGANEGAVQSAAEAGAKIIWFDTNGYAVRPGVIVGSAVIKQEKAAYEKTILFLEGMLPFGTAEFVGVADGFVDFIVDDPDYRAAVPESIREKQIELLNRIRNGELQLR